MKKYGLVLSGGGAKGAFEVGVLKYLYDMKILDNYEIITGVSVGALNATMVAQGDFPLLMDLWRSINKNEDVYKGNPVMRFILGKSSLYDFSPLKKKIDNYVDIAKLRNQWHLKEIHLGVGFVSLNTGQFIIGHPLLENFKDMVYASASMPVFAEPVNMKYGQCIDGGIINTTPLKCAIDWGADDILVVLAKPLESGLGKAEYSGIVDTFKRTLDLTMSEIFRNDIKVCMFKNEHGSKEIKLTIIQPDKHYGDTLNFSPNIRDFLIKRGYETAEAKLNGSGV